MARTKNIEVDGKPLVLTMISMQMADQLERDWHVNRLYLKRAHYIQMIAEHDSDAVKANLDKEIQALDDRIFDATQGYQSAIVKLMLRSNTDILPKDDKGDKDETCWLYEDAGRFDKLRRECMDFRMDNVSIMDRTVELFLIKYSEMKDLAIPAAQVISDFKNILDLVQSGEDKKKS